MLSPLSWLTACRNSDSNASAASSVVAVPCDSSRLRVASPVRLKSQPPSAFRYVTPTSFGQAIVEGVELTRHLRAAGLARELERALAVRV
jgi:hypothetical protein